MSQVFISYSRKDSEFADQLIQTLGEQGVEAWIDREDIEGGELWQKAISRAIADCHACLVVVSEHSRDSVNVYREVNIAVSHKRPVIPLIYGDCDLSGSTLEYILSGLQQISFSDDFSGSLQQLMRALAEKTGTKPSGLAQALARPQAKAPPPPAPQQQQQPVYTPPQQPAPQQPPPLFQTLCGVWNVVGPQSQLYIEVYPNGSAQGRITGAMGTCDVGCMWQILPNGMLTMQGQMRSGWMQWPLLMNVNFTQVTPQFLSGICTDGTPVAWYRLR